MFQKVALGTRLQKVGSFVPYGSILADIGTDHAYLPIYLFEQARIDSAIAVDIHEGPYLSAKNAVISRNLERVIDVRYGDGLTPIKPGEVNTVTIAGMGGNTMLEILEKSPEVLTYVSDMILQPQGSERKVRKALLEKGWLLRNEVLVEEDGLIYVIIAFSKKEGYTLADIKEIEKQWIKRIYKLETDLPEGTLQIISKLFWYFGPLILEKPNEYLKKIIEVYLRQLTEVATELSKARTEAPLKKREIILFEKSLTEELLRWLFR